MPDDFFSHPMCAGQLHMVWFQISQHVTVTWWQTGWKIGPQRTTNCSATKNVTQRGHWITGCMGHCTPCWKKPYSFSSSLKCWRKKNLQKFIQCTFLNILYPKRRCGQIFLLALTAHHTQSLMSDNRNLCIPVHLSANYICYFEYLCGHRSKTITQLHKRIAIYQPQHYILLYKTKLKPYSHDTVHLPEFLQKCKFIWFQRKVLARCMNDFDILVPCDSHLQYFQEMLLIVL